MRILAEVDGETHELAVRDDEVNVLYWSLLRYYSPGDSRSERARRRVDVALTLAYRLRDLDRDVEEKGFE